MLPSIYQNHKLRKNKLCHDLKIALTWYVIFSKVFCLMLGDLRVFVGVDEEKVWQRIFNIGKSFAGCPFYQECQEMSGILKKG